MPGGGPRARLFFPDTNLFVAAIRGRRTDSLRLLLLLVEKEEFDLIGNEILIAECHRYAETFPSAAAVDVLARVVDKIRLVQPADRFQLACEPFFSVGSMADVIHAATCLESGAILISNDHHFDAIASAGLIRVLTLTEAVRRLL